jgi:hypothetical protein
MMAREPETTPGANTEDTVILMAVSRFVSVVVVERRNGSFGRAAPTITPQEPKRSFATAGLSTSQWAFQNGVIGWLVSDPPILIAGV